jgi:hypothetical protein
VIPGLLADEALTNMLRAHGMGVRWDGIHVCLANEMLLAVHT